MIKNYYRATLALTILSIAIGSTLGTTPTNNPLASKQITAFVPFGDSYTDTFSPSNGGTAWPVYAVDYASKTRERGLPVELFPFARSGATCSNNITNRPFPSVFESQLPLWEQEKQNGTLGYLKNHGQDSALYFLWIGTNDVGDNGLLTGHGAPGVTLVDVTTCMINWVKVVYQNGGRNFMFTNVSGFFEGFEFLKYMLNEKTFSYKMLPLQRTPLYSTTSYTNHYWTAERNTTSWNVQMKETVASGNELTKLMLGALLPTLHGIHLGKYASSTVNPYIDEVLTGIFDAYGLFSDILDRPSVYLNGTAPLNTTGAVKSCVYQLNEPTSDTGECTIAQGSDRDSFVW